MKILGIEIKGSTIIGVLTDGTNIYNFPNKIELIDSYDSAEIRKLKKQLQETFEASDLDAIIIKKRLEKGKFAGGAASFKLEGILQLSTDLPVHFISGTQLNAWQKKNNADLSKVKKYQEQSYLAALTQIQ